jgi:hypothetical protein
MNSLCESNKGGGYFYFYFLKASLASGEIIFLKKVGLYCLFIFFNGSLSFFKDKIGIST